MTPSRVLVVDDELLQRKIINQKLLDLGLFAETVQSAAEALQLLQAKDFDVVLLDVQMTVMSGLEALPLIRNIEDAPEVIMLTLDDSLESGISAMRAGAYDYLIKPASSDALEITIGKATEKRRLARQNSTLRGYVKDKSDRADSVTLPVQASAAMRRLAEQAEAIAEVSSTVLITGESGTGKDVLARFIHSRSPRSEAAMIAVNCGAMPESLFESEFFGYEKGAFTGAVALKHGLLEVADGSTLFLDEIGEMPVALQVKLLRFLESGAYRRVGATRELFADARIVAATNRDLTKMIRENKFRSDLYYRLNVIELHVPPLRERREDISALIDDFLEFYKAHFGRPDLHYSEAARRKLIGYHYPGNVRELKNIVERAAALAVETIESDQIHFQKNALTVKEEFSPELGELPDPSFESGNESTFLTENGEVVKLGDLERRHILSVLSFAKGNRERAAALLGISERTLYRRLRDYE